MTAILIRILEGIFALGLIGSFVVLILALIEDAQILVEKDVKPEHKVGEVPAAPVVTAH